MHTYTCVHKHLYIYTCMHTRICTCIIVYIFMYIHTQCTMIVTSSWEAYNEKETVRRSGRLNNKA